MRRTISALDELIESQQRTLHSLTTAWSGSASDTAITRGVRVLQDKNQLRRRLHGLQMALSGVDIVKRGTDFGQFFGPGSLVGVVVGTAYLMLIVLQTIQIPYGFAALVIFGVPLMLTWGWVRQLGTGLVVSMLVFPLTVIVFLIGAGVGGSVFG